MIGKDAGCSTEGGYVPSSSRFAFLDRSETDVEICHKRWGRAKRRAVEHDKSSHADLCSPPARRKQ